MNKKTQFIKSFAPLWAIIVFGILFFRAAIWLSHHKRFNSGGPIQPVASPFLDQKAEPENTPPKTSHDLSQQKIIQDQFKQLLDNTFRSIPTVRDLQALPEKSIHHTPQVLIDAGSRFAEISQFLKTNKNPEILKKAIKFYQDCLTNEAFPNSIRALCLANIELQVPGTLEKNTPAAPARVRKLAREIFPILK